MQFNRSSPGIYAQQGTPKPPNYYQITIGTTPGLVLAQDISQLVQSPPGTPWRSSITFHNPGTFDVFVAPSTDKFGNPIIVAVNGAGTFQVPAGGTWTIDVPGSFAWNGISTNPAVLTVLEYLS